MVNYIFPAVCLIAGILLLIKPDVKINSVYGFRTKTSSVNEQTWKYCNTLCGKILVFIGVISAILVFAVSFSEIKVFGLFSLAEIVHIIMAVALLLSIPFINHRCKKKYPEFYYVDGLTRISKH